MYRADELGRVIDGDTLRFVRTVPHSCERVWRAISDERELAAWMRYPVSFEPRAGGRVRFFGEGRIQGFVFVFEPPRALAFSFNGSRSAEDDATARADWTVRWDLEPVAGGCRVTFTHRRLGGAHLWGLGHGWHGFVDQLAAWLEGTLDELLARRAQLGADAETRALELYREHASRELLEFASASAAAAQAALADGRAEDGRAAVARLEFAARQLHDIARQAGARPDYAPEEPRESRPT